MQKSFLENLTAVLNNEAISNTLFNLKMRWLDESQYENFNEYADVIKSTAVAQFPDLKIEKATQRPFGFVVNISERKIQVFVKRKSNLYCIAAKNCK